MEASGIGESVGHPRKKGRRFLWPFARALAGLFNAIWSWAKQSGGTMALKGTGAVVSGGNGGLGQRICHALAAEGCHIAVVYAQSKDQATAVAHELEKHQVGAAAFGCDVTRRDEVHRLTDDVVKRFGHLDILINDA